MDDLRSMIEFASRFVEKRFAERGEITPMWHAVEANGDHFVMPAPPGGKDVSAALVRAYFELKDVVRCLFISEAWIADTKTPGENDRLLAWMTQHGGRLADYPGCIEVIAFSGEDLTGAMMQAQRRIERPAKGKPRLGPLEFIDMTGVESMGRMVGMLSRRGATVQ